MLISGNVSSKQRHSCWTTAWIARRQTLGFSTTLIQQLANEDYAECRAIFRMDMVSFEKLLGMVAPQICKKDAQMRISISPRDKLLITVRHNMQHCRPTMSARVSPALRLISNQDAEEWRQSVTPLNAG